MGKWRTQLAFSLGVLLASCGSASALDPSLDVSQYAHTAWTFRDGFPVGNIFAMAQTPDGYFWLGGEFGLFRFDGVRATPWKPPQGQDLPDRFVFRLLVTKDGTLWIGTFSGLVTWDGTHLIRHSEFDGRLIQALFEDYTGAVWVGTRGGGHLPSRVCVIQGGSTQCFGDDGSFGEAVWAFYENPSGALWVFADAGLWRWKPAPQTRISPGLGEIGSLTQSKEGRTLIAKYGGGLLQLADGTLPERPTPYPVPALNGSQHLLDGHELDANKLLRDRNGQLWIGRVEHGLVHVHGGRSDVFTKADGLSGDIVLALFEDREGDVWVSTTGGIDRFREFSVANISSKQGLVSDAVASVLADKDGSVWVGTHQGLTRLKDGHATIFRKQNGLADDRMESLFQDHSGRLWAYTGNELSYLQDDRFISVPEKFTGEEVFSITGDDHENLWLAATSGLFLLKQTHIAEHLPWTALGHSERAKVLVADRGGVWLSFWNEGAVSYFKDGRIQESYTAANGLGKGRIANLQLDSDGSLWAASDDGGLSRIQGGHVATLNSGSGLPCDMIHWSIEDNDRSLWLYTVCGLVHIARPELEAWIADPRHKLSTVVLDSADGVGLRAVSPSSYSPTVARATDGKLWFIGAGGVQTLDPGRLHSNEFAPPVHIEQLVADHKSYWQNLLGPPTAGVRLPPRTRDVQIYYTALSLTAPEKIHFKYKLDNQDRDWREVLNDRTVQYSNLPPGHYHFRVMASNNNGLWNEQGDTLEFSIAPAYYQTNWFRAACVLAFLALLWAAYQYRVQRLQRDFEMQLDARVGERTRIARDLHDTLLQSFHGLLLRFQAAFLLLPDRPIEAKEKLGSAIEQAVGAITEGRDAVQGLRASTVERNDLALSISTLGEELENDGSNNSTAKFRVSVEGAPRELHPILRDEIYRIAAEALRNAFRHSQAKQIEVELRYDDDQFRIRVRDDGKGIDPALLACDGARGHYGLHGMRERANLIKGKLSVWSEVDSGTEVELRVPGSSAYTVERKRSWVLRKFAGDGKDIKK